MKKKSARREGVETRRADTERFRLSRIKNLRHHCAGGIDRANDIWQHIRSVGPKNQKSWQLY
jgi:hypothetical protein